MEFQILNIDLLGLIKKRVSCRDYLDKAVPEELINNCIEAARLAPSACNKQPWRFIIVKKTELREEIARKGLLPALPMPWLRKAPVIIALCAEKSTFTHKIAPLVSGVNYHLIDMGIAGEHFVLEAENQGLGTCWIGWFNQKQIKRILDIPRGVEVVSLLSLGFPAAAPVTSSRLAPEDIHFTDKWDGSLKWSRSAKV